MSIENIIADRNIQEILHFTTNKGITGILATNALKSKKLLPEDEYLEHIYMPNCPDRSRDKEYWNYVNMSITSVNTHLFGISSGKWHSDEDGWWCILSFDPIIITHNGVIFTTTNNMYSGVIRECGVKGLTMLFQDKIVQYNTGKSVSRSSKISTAQPTCEQAEVLYPESISLDFLRKIYVANDEDASKLESIIEMFSSANTIEISVNPSMFSN